jgi:hypothetical protein
VELVLEAATRTWRAGQVVAVRLLVLNDGYERVTVDRRLLVGPNLGPGPGRMPPPVQVEPPFDEEERNQILLNPWCLYGRQREFPNLPAGEVTFYGYLLRRPVEALLPRGPADAEALLVEAEPLVLTIQ